jgi:hypothetical protein
MPSQYDTERFEDFDCTVGTSRKMPRLSRQAQKSKTERALAQKAKRRNEKMRKNARASRSYGLETDNDFVEIAREMEEQEFWEMLDFDSVAESPTLIHTVRLGGETPPHTSDNVTDKFEMIYSAGTFSVFGSGYFMVRCRGDTSSQVFVGYYFHDNCSGVDDAIGKQLSSPPDERWVWTGNVHDFMRDIVYKGMDLQMPHRPLDRFDYNYDITTFYEAACEWYELQYLHTTQPKKEDTNDDEFEILCPCCRNEDWKWLTTV